MREENFPMGDVSGEKDLLRFITCGSVDDGKSTLIGRLLHDSQLILQDQLAALAADSARHGTTGDDLDLALLVDGLEAEREQGITIDVAYRFFNTPKRSFLVADTPGHEQYTRNMVTGASTADLAIILIDARKGLLVQTKRHSFICSLMGIRNVILAVNKIDLVDYSKDVFERIVSEYTAFASSVQLRSIVAIPISARYGDNVIHRSRGTDWYRGPMLLDCLETIDVAPRETAQPFRFPVQWVNRPNLDFRGYAGTVASGAVAVGDEIVVTPAGYRSRIERLVSYDGDLDSAGEGAAITVTLADDIDVARGDVLVHPAALPDSADQFAGHVIWMDRDHLVAGRSYLLRIGTRFVPGTITTIKFKIDVNTREHLAARTLELNEIGFCNLATIAPVSFDPYDDVRKTGCFIIIDRYSNRTVGAGMIAHALRRATNIQWQSLTVGKAERSQLKRQKPCIVWFTGLSGSGKSTIANALDQKLFVLGHHTALLDGDNVRHGLNRDLGFTEQDRVENIRRVGEVAKLMVDAGLIVICSFISPYRAERDMVRGLVGPGEFFEIFVDTPIEECARRDPKGLYARAKAGKIKNFTGLDAPYDRPKSPELHLLTADAQPTDLSNRILDLLGKSGVIAFPSK